MNNIIVISLLLLSLLVMNQATLAQDKKLDFNKWDKIPWGCSERSMWPDKVLSVAPAVYDYRTGLSKSSVSQKPSRINSKVSRYFPTEEFSKISRRAISQIYVVSICATKNNQATQRKYLIANAGKNSQNLAKDKEFLSAIKNRLGIGRWCGRVVGEHGFKKEVGLIFSIENGKFKGKGHTTWEKHLASGLGLKGYVMNYELFPNKVSNFKSINKRIKFLVINNRGRKEYWYLDLDSKTLLGAFRSIVQPVLSQNCDGFWKEK